MADTNTNPILLSFGYGEKANLPNDYTQGKIYITTDTKEMYIDLPGTTDRLCLSNYLVGSTLPATGESGQFFVKTTTTDGTTNYSLYCYEGGWKLIVDTAALQSTIDGLAKSLGTPVANSAGKADGTAYERIAKNASDIADHASRLTTVETTAGTALQPGDLDGYVTDDELEAYDTTLRGGYAGDLKAIKDQADKGVDDAATAQGTAESAASAAATAQDTAEAAQERADDAYELAESKTTMAAVEAKGYDTVDSVNGKFTALRDGYTGTLKELADGIDALESADEALDARITPIEAVIGGVTGAMHFIGISTTNPITVGNTAGKVTIDGKEVTTFTKGDVVIYDNKEYVYNGSSWAELGDTTQEAQRIGALEEEINGKTGVAGLKERMTTAEGDIDDLQSADEALSGRLDALEGWDDGIDESIDDHEQRIDALETTVNTTHADLLSGLRSDLGTNDKANTTAFARIAALEEENETQTSAIVGLGNQLTWVAF